MSKLRDLSSIENPSSSDLFYIVQNETDYKLTAEQFVNFAKSAIVIPVTQAQYNALTPAQKSNGSIYLITDSDITAEDIPMSSSDETSVAEKIATIPVYPNAGSHNSIYRGKNLGSSVTAEQYAEIDAGTFNDLFIGDYWVINDVNWRIAAFDYYLGTGNTECTTHHVTIVPDTNLDTQPMNASNTTEGGYVGSKMYTANMATAKNKIISAFGSAHILSHRLYLDNTVKDGYPSARAWVDSQIELMSEQNVYGGVLYHGIMNGTAVPNVTDVDKSQFPLFAHNPYMISNRQTYWLRNVVSASNFAIVNYSGNADTYHASSALGVRPAFSIKA